MVYADNHDCIAWLSQQLLAQGDTKPHHHAVSRPMVVEREATHRAISLAEVSGTPVFIVHVSRREALEQIAWAQNRGLPVYGETCPQYLFLSADDMERPDFEGAKFMCSPPPRDRANPETLWRALKHGTFQVFSSDHSPSQFEGPDGKKAHGTDAPFTKIANGVPGLKTRLPLMFSEGVSKGRISANEFVALTATSPTRMCGLGSTKGTIAVGSDADIVLWNPDHKTTLTNDLLHHNVDVTPYEGMVLTGWPVTTLSRREIVWDYGEVLAEPGQGRFLARSTPEPILRHRQTNAKNVA